jgi:hypothetical protein
MIVGATPEGPEEFTLLFFDRKIIDAGEAAHHEALFPAALKVEPESTLRCNHFLVSAELACMEATS